MVVIEHAPRVSTGVVRRAFAAFLVLHGVAHLVGTGDSFGRAADGKTAEYLNGLWKVSDPQLLRALGVAWALSAAGYAVAAFGFWFGTRWRLTTLVAATVFSLALSVAGLSASVVGVAIDVAILGVAVWIRVRTPSDERAQASNGREER